MHSIVEAVSLHMRQQPERPAIFFEGRTLSYGELYANVERFAQALIAAGLQAGERVALFLENSPAFVVSYLGTHLAGGIVVLVNTQYRQVELSHIMNDAGVRFCVTSSLRAPKRRTMVAVGPFIVDLKYSQHAKLHSGWFTVPGPTSKGLETPSYPR